MRIPKWLLSFIFLFPLSVFPLILGGTLTHSLAKLHLSPEVASLIVFGMLAGGFVDLPIQSIAKGKTVAHHPLAILGLSEFSPGWRRFRDETFIAVNFGGCLVALGPTLYEVWRVGSLGPSALLNVGLAALANVVLCYLIARPVPHIGVSVPAIVPPVAAAGLALLLMPDQAPLIALVAGIFGPLFGADVLHLKEASNIDVGVVSIGGAGTFDAIMLSAVISVYLG